MTEDGMITDYRQRISHLESLLAAEKRENGRLWVAVAHLRSAAAIGRHVAERCFQESTNGSPDNDTYEAARDGILQNIIDADDALLPFTNTEALEDA